MKIEMFFIDLKIQIVYNTFVCIPRRIGFEKFLELPMMASLKKEGVRNMYAIIETGGKQVKVEVGQEIFVEKLNVETDQEYTFDKVLMVGGDKTKIGTPYIKNASVTAKVVKNGKQKKVIVYKYESKKDYHKKQGHRQPYTKLIIEQINVG